MEDWNGSNQKRVAIIAVAAGCMGLVSFGLLAGGLMTRRGGGTGFLFRGQDVAVAIQAFLMVLVTLATLRYRMPLLRQTRRVAAVGMLGQVGVVLSIAFVFASGAFWADMLYMLPQGLIGLWLIAVCWSTSSFAVSVRAIGLLAGMGLLLITISAAIIATALGWHIFDLSAKPAVAAEALASQGNRLGHVILPLGTLLDESFIRYGSSRSVSKASAMAVTRSKGQDDEETPVEQRQLHRSADTRNQ